MRAMNKPRTPFLLTAAIPVLLATLPACAQEEAGADNGDEAPVAETWDEKASYALGVNIGSNLDPEDLTLDADLVLRGFMDALEGTEAMESEEIDSVLGELSTKMQEHADRARKAAMMENTAKSAAFLAAKAGEDGIVKTDSGLLYREIRPGEGDSPAATQAVTVNYRGTLIDGTQFDSSYDRGQPATFPVGGVIPGWTAALQPMKPGATWELFIPAEHAYGAHGSTPTIPPPAALSFEVELRQVA